MDEATARGLIRDHFAAAGRDEVAASTIYAEDAILEFPQGGERIRGKARILGFRSAYPASLDFDLRRTVGSGDVWVNEYTIRYDGRPSHVIGAWSSATIWSSARRSMSPIPGTRPYGAPNGSNR
jgi:ketosteroid isomerase-like protein